MQPSSDVMGFPILYATIIWSDGMQPSSAVPGSKHKKILHFMWRIDSIRILEELGIDSYIPLTILFR
jgi:hypothetical protein